MMTLQRQFDAPIVRRSFLKHAGGCVASLATLQTVYARPLSIQRGSGSRRIWLRLLLELVEADIRAGRKTTEQQQYLAGLTGVRFVYLDERNKDVILEGPAEDTWVVRPDGMVVGEQTGRPLLQLDDFAVAWRNTVGNHPAPSVSLDPRRESIRRIQEVIRSTPQPTTADARADYTRRLEQAWGPQDAVTGGLPANTRFNMVMVNADWEMKRISLGLSDTGIEKFPTYVDLEFEDWRRRVLAEGIRARRPEGGSRFWFYPGYTEFEHSEKLDAFEIPGDAVQLLTESHFRDIAQGARQVTPEPSPTAKEFVRGFTQLYGELAQRNPLFSDLRNLFDWVAVSRLIQKIDAPRRIGWDLGFLARGYSVADIGVPAVMPGQVALRHAEVRTAAGLASLVLPARGGVCIDVRPALCGSRSARRADLRDRAQWARATRPDDHRFWL